MTKREVIRRNQWLTPKQKRRLYRLDEIELVGYQERPNDVEIAELLERNQVPTPVPLFAESCVDELLD